MSLTTLQKKALEHLEEAPLCCAFVDGVRHFSFADGRAIHPRTAQSLIQRELVEPSGDAMFGETQTYRLANA